MTLDGAVLSEHGVTFALTTIPFALFKEAGEPADLVANIKARLFPDLPVVLMTREWSGMPRYYGDAECSRAMAGVHVSRIAWQRYTLA
ncbi:MAG: hypothetical protein NVSMB5_18070 [Candidatus Velthaea sp.]